MRFRNTAHALVRKVFYFRCLEIRRFGGFSILSLSRDHSLAQQKRIGPPVNRLRQKAQGLLMTAPEVMRFRRMSAPVKRSRRKAWRYRKTERSEKAPRTAADVFDLLPYALFFRDLFLRSHGAQWLHAVGHQPEVSLGEFSTKIVHAQNYSIIRCTRYG